MVLIFLYSRRRSIWDNNRSQKLNKYCWSISYVGRICFFVEQNPCWPLHCFFLFFLLLDHIAGGAASCWLRVVVVLILAHFFFLVRSMRNEMKTYEHFANFQGRSIPCAWSNTGMTTGGRNGFCPRGLKRKSHRLFTKQQEIAELPFLMLLLK